jgi:uncharacterized protein (DUF2164 family)
MSVKLTKEQREKAIRDIKYYYSKEREEEITNLASELLLDFFLKEIAPMVYNEGLKDAKAWFTTKLSDLDVDFMLLEKE